MTRLYKRLELIEGEPVQFLGVYALRWRPEWGEPTVGFVEEPGPSGREVVERIELAFQSLVMPTELREVLEQIKEEWQ